MVSKFFSRSTPDLPPDSHDMAIQLRADAAPEVRIGAAQRCRDLEALEAAWGTETDPTVRDAIAASLAASLALTADSARAQALLESHQCTDEIRSGVACLTQDPQRRAAALAAMRTEQGLIQLALTGELAETRIAAAERVRTLEGLKNLADCAKDKDRGVARLARQRIDAMNDRLRQQAQADAIIGQLEALAAEPGAILTAVVELDRRWQALDMSEDPGRRERFGAVRHTIQARFDREQDEPRRRFQFERRLRESIGTLERSLGEPGALSALRTELAALRFEAEQLEHGAALSQIGAAEQRITQQEEDQLAQAGAETLVEQAEQLAAGTSIDSVELLARWQTLNQAARTPELKRRFKAATSVIERRRMEQQESAKQDAIARRHRLHGLLHTAEQALASGQLQAARAAADEVKALKAQAGDLPRPTTQRFGRLSQQLAELERWETFGQQTARLQLCERAEALSAQTMEAMPLALEVRKLRDEWKALDQLHAGVPKALWLRFDAACEKAYAPAARRFAELAARSKEARRRRKEFIAAAETQAPTLLGESPDWRRIEQWLRETERSWREGDLGSLDPAAWKKLDAKLKAVLAPLREALSAACEQAKGRRRALIEEATALVPKAMERDTPSQVKAIQARWQAEAKALQIPRHDERALWEQFRAACDAVFEARQAKRKDDDLRKSEGRRALEDLCVQLERLALEKDKDDQSIRGMLRDLQGEWSTKSGGAGPDSRGVQSRFERARTSVEAMLSGRERSRKAVVWEVLAKKERLCEELDTLVRSSADSTDPAARSAAAQEEWTSLPAMPAAWEQKLAGRRDAALAALADPDAADEYRARIEDTAESRRQGLVELELALGLESPAEDQARRLASQMKKLKDRFQRAATTGGEGATEQLLAWCAQPGVCGPLERQRSEMIFSRIARTPIKL